MRCAASRAPARHRRRWPRHRSGGQRRDPGWMAIAELRNALRAAGAQLQPLRESVGAAGRGLVALRDVWEGQGACQDRDAGGFSAAKRDFGACRAALCAQFGNPMAIQGERAANWRGSCCQRRFAGLSPCGLLDTSEPSQLLKLRECYAATLPPVEDCGHFPLFWDLERSADLLAEVERCFCVAQPAAAVVFEAIEQLQERIDAEYQLLRASVASLRSSREAEALDVSRERYFWARTMVLSRSFSNPNAVVGEEQGRGGGYGDDDQMFLVPFADLVNHASATSAERGLPVPNAVFDYNGHRDGFVLEATRTIPSGDEIWIRYGRKSALDLFLRYGFVPDVACLSSDAYPELHALDVHLNCPRQRLVLALAGEEDGKQGETEAPRSFDLVVGLGSGSSTDVQDALEVLRQELRTSPGAGTMPMVVQEVSVVGVLREVVDSHSETLRWAAEVHSDVGRAIWLEKLRGFSATTSDEFAECPEKLRILGALVLVEAEALRTLRVILRCILSVLQGGDQDGALGVEDLSRLRFFKAVRREVLAYAAYFRREREVAKEGRTVPEDVQDSDAASEDEVLARLAKLEARFGVRRTRDETDLFASVMDY
eukprot:scaffold5800_cov189-Pinguiococcus_pyrenoidosus.AAC.2